MSLKLFYRLFIIKDFNSHFKTLFEGALPVFVAATISRAVTTFIDGMTGDNLPLIITLNFIYALVFGHILGFIIMVKVETETILHTYLIRLAIENASFAWLQTFSLIILKRLYNNDSQHIGPVLGAWIVSVTIVLSLVYATNYLRHVIFPITSKKIQTHLLEFDSETFALAIAFTFTIIIASLIYSNESSNYITGIDDVQPLDNDYELDNSVDWLYLLYAMFVTVIVTIIEYYNGFPRLSPYITATHEPLLNLSDERLSSLTTTTTNTFSNRFNQIFFNWDNDNNAKHAFTHLFMTTRGYLVASAWYAYSVLSFQNYFTFSNQASIFGLLLFATAITYITLKLLSEFIQLNNLQTNEDIDIQLQIISKKSVVRDRLLLITGR